MDPFTRTIVLVGIKLSSFEIVGQERILKKAQGTSREKVGECLWNKAEEGKWNANSRA